MQVCEWINGRDDVLGADKTGTGRGQTRCSDSYGGIENGKYVRLG